MRLKLGLQRHRQLSVALHQCLGLPRFAGNTASLVEAKDQTVAMHIRIRAMNHITRMYGARSATSLLSNIEERSDSHMVDVYKNLIYKLDLPIAITFLRHLS